MGATTDCAPIMGYVSDMPLCVPNSPPMAPTQGDAVLIEALDGGKRPHIAFKAGEEPLTGGSICGEEDAEDEHDEYDEDGEDKADRHSSASSSTMSISDNTMPPDLQPPNCASRFGVLAATALPVPTPSPGTSPPLRDLGSANVRAQHHQQVQDQQLFTPLEPLRKRTQPQFSSSLLREPTNTSPHEFYRPPMQATTLGKIELPSFNDATEGLWHPSGDTWNGPDFHDSNDNSTYGHYQYSYS
ncbi:hypothetical protein JX266_013615 [Neoarthrinium moseri]|nr:hypothetical protein JX266_013615 [Neoarthrinium moseri]